MNSFKPTKFGSKPVKPAEKLEDVTNYGLWHLGRRDHSKHELKIKLGRKTDNDEWIEEVIEQLDKSGFLDDQRFVDNFLREYNQFKKFGPTRIKQEFRLKGIDNELVRSTMEQSEFDYFESALEYMNNKYSYPIEDRKEKDKITRFLLSRGFTFDMIKYAFSDHLKENDE